MEKQANIPNVFPFLLEYEQSRSLFTLFIQRNKLFIKQFGENWRWFKVEGKVIDANHIIFNTFDVNEDPNSYHYGKREDHQEFYVTYGDGELNTYIQRQKRTIAIEEFDRREEERLRAERYARVASVYRELFGEDMI